MDWLTGPNVATVIRASCGFLANTDSCHPPRDMADSAKRTSAKIIARNPVPHRMGFLLFSHRKPRVDQPCIFRLTLSHFPIEGALGIDPADRRMMMTRTEKSRQIKRGDVNSIKHRLMDVLAKIERDGLKRDADQLGNIIARLEDWQHR